MPLPLARCARAGNGTRTRDPNLGKVVLYQLSYSRTRPKLAATGRADKMIVTTGTWPP